MMICERKISLTPLNYIGHVRGGARKYESFERREGIHVSSEIMEKNLVRNKCGTHSRHVCFGQGTRRYFLHVIPNRYFVLTSMIGLKNSNFNLLFRGFGEKSFTQTQNSCTQLLEECYYLMYPSSSRLLEAVVRTKFDNFAASSWVRLLFYLMKSGISSFCFIICP